MKHFIHADTPSKQAQNLVLADFRDVTTVPPPKNKSCPSTEAPFSSYLVT